MQEPHASAGGTQAPQQARWQCGDTVSACITAGAGNPSGCVQETQSSHASVDAWMDLVRSLPVDPEPELLMSHSALKATIIRIYDMRTADIDTADNPHELVARDSVFDSIANYYNQQYAGDSEEVYMPELMLPDGPVARLIMSCRSEPPPHAPPDLHCCIMPCRSACCLRLP
jgi:hypothetical protein